MMRSARSPLACWSTIPRPTREDMAMHTTYTPTSAIASLSRTFRVGGESQSAPPRQQNADEKRKPEPEIDDEQRVAVEPSIRERHQEAHAVRVEQIQQRVRPHPDRRERDEPSPARGGGVSSRFAKPARPAHECGEEHGEHEHRENSVRPPATKGERVDAVADEIDECVDVREVGGDRERRGAEGRLAAKAGLGDRESSQGVGEVVHSCFGRTAKTSDVRIRNQNSDNNREVVRAGVLNP